MISRLLNYRYTFFCVFVLLATSCGKEEVQPHEEDVLEPVANYRLIELNYLMAETGSIDTNTVELPGFTILNPSDIASKQQITIDYESLMKRSQFTLDPSTSLPQGLSLDTIMVHVPSSWIGESDYSLYPTPFPLSQDIEEQPYESYGEKVFELTVPSGSKIEVRSEIDAYELTCAFTALLENTTTGERHTVEGSWNGLLRYNNSRTRVDEYPLD